MGDSKIINAVDSLLNATNEEQDKIINDLLKDIDEPKMYLIFNRSLNMPVGKLAAQLSHAAVCCSLNLFNKTTTGNKIFFHLELDKGTPTEKWIDEKFAKVVLYVKSEEKLLSVYNKAIEQGFNACLIKDEGRTFFDKPTYTCVGIGPAQPSKVENITKRLQVYKD